MCLEEMLDCTITQGALYYGEIKHRVNIQITEGIKQNVKDLCLPELEKTGNVETYMNNILAEDLEDNT